MFLLRLLSINCTKHTHILDTNQDKFHFYFRHCFGLVLLNFCVFIIYTMTVIFLLYYFVLSFSRSRCWDCISKSYILVSDYFHLMNENLLSLFAFLYCLYMLLHVSLVHYIVCDMR